MGGAGWLRRRTSLLAWAGAAGIAGYVAIDAALAFLRPDYSLLHNAESDYGVGPWSWLMDVNFVLRGAATLAVVAAVALGVRRSPLLGDGLALLCVWAVGSCLLAFFPDDPAGTPATASGRIHLLIAAIAFLTVAAGTTVASFALRRDQSWRGRAVPLIVISVLAIAALLLLGPQGFRPHSDGGLFERVFLGLELLWLLIVALYLTRNEPAGPQRGAVGPAATGR